MGEASVKEFSVTYTAGSGFRDWLCAKLDRQPFYGAGEIEFAGPVIVLRGLQRTWLGVPQDGERIMPVSAIAGAWQEGSQIEVLEKRRWRRGRILRLRARSDLDAAAISAALPPPNPTQADVRDFQRRLRASGRHALVTPALILINLAVYAALIWATGRYGGFDIGTLDAWGANFSAETVNGQWWRLISYTFLHGFLLHIAVNMWVLWNVGRLTEKLYGSFVFLAIYLLAGAAGGLLSIAWDPARQAIGASGAIFGILGALIACLWLGRAHTPRGVLRAHWLPTILFCLYSIANGAIAANVDNAAHVGGLVAGLLLGLGLTRPLSEKGFAAAPKSAIGISALSGAFAALAGLVWLAANPPATLVDQYLAAHKWYSRGETPNLIRWRQLAMAAAAGTVSGQDMSEQFETQIVPFWRMASTRLQAEKSRVPPAQMSFDGKFRNFVDLKRQLAEAVLKASRDSDQAAGRQVGTLMEKSDYAGADVERLELRSNMQHRTHAFANSTLSVALQNLVWFNFRPCVEYPFPGMNKPAATDDQSDAPAISHALGCQAQRLFLKRDFAGLQTLLSAQEKTLDGLPDGSSGLEAVMDGLDDLLSYGGLTIDQMMDRTAQWRQAYPRSLYPEFAETSALLSWAYYARGFGSANTINGQNLQLFSHRVAMADSSLQDLEPRGKSSPLWYELSLTVGLLKSTDKKDLRAVYEEGISRYPEHHALYHKMLHVLMPRWLGSPAEVGGFIYDQVQKEGKTDRSDQIYAELLVAYSTLEDDEVDIFQQENAQWDAMQWGLAGLIKRYPGTDVYRNALAKFACEKQDWPEYRVFSRRYPAHYSASVWSQKLSIDSCNLGAAAADAKRSHPAPEAP